MGDGSRRSKTRKNRKVSRRRGGGKIAEGSFGEVFRPPLPCVRKTHNAQDSEDQVSKRVTEVDARQEMKATRMLREIDPKAAQTVPVLHACMIEEEVKSPRGRSRGRSWNSNNWNERNNNSEDRPMQVIQEYAGVSLDKMIAEDDEYLMDPDSFDRVDKKAIGVALRAIQAFLPQLQRFNQTHFHRDLHLGNLVWDGKRLRMIDFGTLISRSTQISQLRKREGDSAESVAEAVDLARLFQEVRDRILLTPFFKQHFEKDIKYWKIANASLMRRSLFEQSAERIVEAFRTLPTADL